MYKKKTTEIKQITTLELRICQRLTVNAPQTAVRLQINASAYKFS